LSCINADQTGDCDDYEVSFCCPDPIDLVAGNCPNSEWSGWIDRDDPHSGGDNEVMDGSIHYHNICANPTGAEGRIRGSQVSTTTEVVTMDITGLVCLTADQPLTCSDYEVRFCCPDAVNLAAGNCPNQRWSDFINKGAPSATGDNEVIDGNVIYQDNDICQNPTGAEARIAGGLATTTTQVVTMVETGLVCRNEDQNGDCEDYEVRFCCPDPVVGTSLVAGTCTNGRWSGWMDIDNPDDHGGDMEVIHANVPSNLPDSCPRPTGVEARIVGTTDSSTTEVVRFFIADGTHPTSGLTCVNSEQPGGSICSDYQVRFCCPDPDPVTVTTLVAGTCPSDQWSVWINHDDPGDGGDIEMIGSNNAFNVANTIPNICENPTGVEGRKVGTQVTTTTQDNVVVDLSGLRCVDITTVGSCFDYEVRFCCPTTAPVGGTHLVAGTCPSGIWTGWFNNDHPTVPSQSSSGFGDVEIIGPDVPDNINIHTICQSPTGVEGRVAGTNDLTTSQEVTMVITAGTSGLVCLNADQTGDCFNYEVRFCCPDDIAI